MLSEHWRHRMDGETGHFVNKTQQLFGNEKEAFLDQACQDTADKVTKATLKVSKPLDAVPDEPEETVRREGWSDDSEF